MNTSTKISQQTTIFSSDGNFAIHVTDLKKAENFYSNVLGFKLLEKTNEKLVYDTAKFNLYINKYHKIITFIPALQVKDYENAKKYLIQNGCKIIIQCQVLRHCILKILLLYYGINSKVFVFFARKFD